MATVDQIAEVREYVAEPGITNGWTDERIGEYIDREADLFLAASAIWSSKAASYASLVNVSESGSSRSMGSLIDNALKMAKEFKGRSTTPGSEAVPGDIILTRLVRK
jgi:adenine-specific DNA methylase